MQYLKIENIGVAPTECFTMLGVSTSRYSQNNNVIGMFGSGSKHAVNMFLRNDLKFYIYCSNVCLDFFTKDKYVNDGISENKFDQVCCRITGKTADDKTINRTEDLGWTLQNGQLDWVDLSMACREYVSNALDRCMRQTESHKQVVVEIVEENQVRAKKDYTRIFLPFVEDVVTFYYTLSKRFLQFGENYNNKLNCLEKTNRNIKYTNGSPVIYRKGVYVREIKSNVPSVFDYNFGTELEIDESRNAGDYVCREVMCKALDNCDKVKLLNAILSGDVYEKHLSHYDLQIHCENKESWVKTWNVCCSPIHVLSSGLMDDLLRSKGLIPVNVGESWYNFLKNCGVPVERNFLNVDEVEGREILPLTPATETCLHKVWEFLENNNYTMGYSKPECKIFRKIQNGPKTLGFYKDNVVYINKDIADGFSINLLQTMLEEVTHHVTQANDMSRELQEFLFRIIAEKLL